MEASSDAVRPGWTFVTWSSEGLHRRRVGRARLRPRGQALFLGSVARFPGGFYREPDEATVLAPVRQHRFTVYDASYPERVLKATPRKISASIMMVIGMSSAGRTMA